MTIVPSEVNENGEVSYVLIVSQPDDGTKQEEDDDMDMSIYDFKVQNNEIQLLRIRCTHPLSPNTSHDPPEPRILPVSEKKVRSPHTTPFELV